MMYQNKFFGTLYICHNFYYNLIIFVILINKPSLSNGLISFSFFPAFIFTHVLVVRQKYIYRLCHTQNEILWFTQNINKGPLWLYFELGIVFEFGERV